MVTTTPAPTSPKPKKKLWQRKIPTILGIVVLLAALVSGMLVFGEGTGVFAPRATPQTTPKKIHVTNITDSSFSISFFTDEATVGFIKYGTEGKLKSQASDDRDQLSGSIGKYTVHHITVRGLQPNTTYSYVLGTGSGSQFDNSGSAFTTKTAARGGVPPAAKTIYGSVVSSSGSPAEGAVVYVTIPDAGEQSSLVKSSGSWAIPLSTARNTAGTDYATVTDDTPLTILAQGSSANLVSQMTTTLAAAQPVATITLGESAGTVAQTTTTPTGTDSAPDPVDTNPETEQAASDSGELALTNLETDETSTSTNSGAIERGGLGDLLTTSATGSAVATESAILDLAEAAQKPEEKPVLTTTQPKITGSAPPNIVITVEVNSDTKIQAQLTTDANGNWVLDTAAMSKQLEPGEHTVTYSYTDPTTGQVVTKTQTFTVAPQTSGTGGTGTQLAATNPTPSPTPYGSGNPYPIGGATSSATASPSGSASGSGRVSVPSTSSGIPVSGSVGTTWALVFGGLFFLIAAGWSYWIAQQLEDELA